LPKKPVGVACNLAGTFNNGWTGAQPAWTVTPESLKCQHGNNKITWTLTAQNVPTGFSAAFTNPGVVFKPVPPWTGSTPANQSNGTITADNNFRALPAPVKFDYTASVTVTPNPGTPYPPQTFSYDPDVENEGGGIFAAAAPRKPAPKKAAKKRKAAPKKKSKKAPPKKKKAAKKKAGAKK